MGGGMQQNVQSLLRMGLLPLLAKKMGVNIGPQPGQGAAQPGFQLPQGEQTPPQGAGQPGQKPPQAGGGGYQIQPDKMSNVGNFNPPTPQPINEIHSLEQLITGWSSRKQQKQQAEASNAAQALMQAIEGAKTTGDWSAANDILHENEKLFNKVYKGWLQKAESQKKQSQAGQKTDPDTHGFEQGVQAFLEKKQSGGGQPQGGPQAPQQGSAPSTLGGYHLPAASPTQQFTQQGVSAARQATQQDPASSLSTQLTSGERREGELADVGLADTPKTEAERAKYAAEIEKAKAGVETAHTNYQKAQTELQKSQTEVQKSGFEADKERTSLKKATIEVDIARWRLLTEMERAKNVGKKQKTVPISSRLKWEAISKAEEMINDVAQSGRGLTLSDLKDLQNELKASGASALASSLPMWRAYVPGKIGTSEISSGVKMYKDGIKKALDETYPGWQNESKQAAPEGEGEGESDESGSNEEVIDLRPPKKP